MREQDILRRIREAYQELLGENLTGLYVHGSLALGCFCWERSDIDFLAVVKRPLSQAQKEALIRALLALDADCPPKGLEMSVVLESACKPFRYPTPFELHFSNLHKQACRDHLARYCRKMNGVDPDLAAHCTIARKAGIVLCGRPIADVLGEVPRADYIDSILRDAADAREAVTDQPASTVLNLCRVLAALREGAALSKQQGGEWALAQLPEVHRGVIKAALRLYAGENEPMNQEAVRAFVAYALNAIAQRRTKGRNERMMDATWERLYQSAMSVVGNREISAGHMEVGSVATAVLTRAGNVYTGICIDTSSSLGMCAERNALSTMLTHGENEVERVLSVYKDGHVMPSCGACREFMMQLGEHAPEILILLDNDGRTATLRELMPEYPY